MATERRENDKNEVETKSELISRRAEVFRSKLIHEFHLLETIGEEGGFDATNLPYLFTRDVIEEKRCQSMMITEPYSLIQFQVYSNKTRQRVTAEQRRLNRVRNKNSRIPSFDVVAHWIVNGRWFNILVKVMLFVNAIIVGIDVEVYQYAPDRHPKVQLGVDIVSMIALGIFTIEVFLKLIDNFWMFWTSNWNIFDLIVTFFSVSCEIVKFASMAEMIDWRYMMARRLTTLRVLRSVKLIIYFDQVRILMLTIARAGQELLLTSALIILIGYIYAVFGVAAFDYASIEADDEEIVFPHSIDTVFHSLQTIFQIMTNDHWIQLIKELRLTSGGVLAYFYVISWLFLGSYLLINLVTGSLCSYYTTVRMEMTSEQEHAAAAEDAENQLNQLVDQLDEETADRDMQPTTQESTSSAVRSRSGSDWQTTVEHNLSNLALDDSTFYWAADTLFQYHVAMEALQENLEERKQLLHMMTQALLALNDT